MRKSPPPSVLLLHSSDDDDDNDNTDHGTMDALNVLICKTFEWVFHVRFVITSEVTTIDYLLNTFAACV